MKTAAYDWIMVVRHLNSKSTHQDSADECKYGEHHQHIESQGKVHATSLPFAMKKPYQKRMRGQNGMRAALRNFKAAASSLGSVR
jgi:hypothetical protein